MHVNTGTIQTENQNIADSILHPVLHPSAAIEVNDVTVSFKTPKGIFTAVRNISMTVQKGEIISLIGHSGCGKSTLMGTISGMVKPAKGEVMANGKKVTGPGPDRGIVFQNYSLLPWLSVYNNIYVAVDAALKTLPAKEKKALVEKNLKMVNLWDHKDKLPGQL
jgi:nitrate/nitrite transport system ATP-binding protein